ncbi:organic solvent tolerance protein OstA [Hylemonella gracilis str. Niagara R]|uniref:Lipopolysaccharide export system protein LptA n=1 Tax=Hylemonella gracilis str. Niagara R TaxID=1458275 RepID=A0A016XEA3_9BURK|nr:lipopolysaccharide transport periplasmic protein LptA [Hylemonella gracilis]EYC50141.1 organic solvent tolerance protein OstA [Hylemonella gracilis str. Niagara R]
MPLRHSPFTLFALLLALAWIGLLMAISLPADAQTPATRAGAAPTAPATPAPAAQAMHIEADALRYDDQRQISVFSGNVVLTRGGITIEGERIEVRQDPQGYQYGHITAALGERARLTQLREGMNETVVAESNTIEYDGRADVFKLLGDARLRRLRGGAEADYMSGQVIVYDNLRDIFTIDGAKTNGAVPTRPNTDTRVRATLSPRTAVQPAQTGAAPDPNGNTELNLRNDPRLAPTPARGAR